MLRLFAALAVVVALVHRGEAVLGKFNDPTVDCSATGFQPTFEYNTEGENQNLGIEIDIGGDSDNTSDCVHTVARNTAHSGNTSFTYSHFAVSAGGSNIPFTTSSQPTCGGTFEHWNDTNNQNKEYIRYQVTVNAIVTRTFRNKIDRKTQYPFLLTCLLERDIDGIRTNNSFQVREALVNAANETKAENTFNFAATLKFYDSTYGSINDNELIQVNNNEKLYLQVEQDAGQSLFKFVVNKCYATENYLPLTDGNAKRDVFFDNGCPLDETVQFSTVAGKFRFDILSFSFPTAVNSIWFHCDLYVCLTTNTSPACTQAAQSSCSGARRRRRSAEGVDYERSITASQAVLFDGAQVVAPSCGNGFVYDRVLEECSNVNVMEVRGIRLSQDVFNADYANTSSLAFKELAKAKEYQLWVLLRTTQQHNIIHGVKVIRARPGSVILDIEILHAASVTAEQAFTTFKQVLKTPASQTRVQNILRIDNERIIKYVPVMSNAQPDTEKLILIVVVVVLFVVVFIAGVTLFKVKQVRQASSTRVATGFENKGIDA